MAFRRQPCSNLFCRAVTYYTLDSVLMAFALTCIVTCALTAYAMKTNKDFSAWGAGYVLFL